MSYSFPISTRPKVDLYQVVSKTPPRPFLLAKSVHPLVVLEVFWDRVGSVFGVVSNSQQSYKVPLKGFPATLAPALLGRAIKTLQRCRLKWDGRAITLNIPLAGGSPTKELNPALPSQWSIPKENSAFIGREPLLGEIKKRLAEGEEASIKHVAVAGLGGVGKTSLVLEYLHRNKNGYSMAWWISAEYPMSGYRDLGEALGIVKPTDKGDVVLEAVKRWLETNTGWILVFDNVEDQKTIAPYLPATGKGGHIITTSRNPHAKDSLVVDLFSPEESVELLKRLTGQPTSDQTKKLAELLGRLPLALTQAGAYMQATQTSFIDYLSLFDQERKALWQDEKAPKGYPETVGTTWNISVKKIESQMPEALELLYLSAYLAPDNIPKFLFFAGKHEPLTLSQRLHVLQKYSLFTVGQKEETYSVHRLVQAAARDKVSSLDVEPVLESLEEDNLLETLFERLGEGWKFDYERSDTWPKAKLLLEHLVAVVAHKKDSVEFFPDMSTFLNGLGEYHLSVEVNPDLAVEELTQSLEMRQRYNGGENREVAVTLSNLGVAYAAQGKNSQAIEYQTKSLQIRKKVCGTNDPNVAVSLNNLGAVQHDLGNFSLAIDYYRQSLSIEKRVYGEQDPKVAKTLNNLGVTYRAQENFDQATLCFNEALSIYKTAYSPEDHHVAICLYNLGDLYRAQGSLERAAVFLKQSLMIRKKVYGEDHPLVASVLQNLGELYHDQGDLLAAINDYQKALAILRKVYGEEHTDIARSLNSLGMAYCDQNQLPAAIDCLNRALAIWTKVYGEDHPDAATTLNNLGMVCRAQRDLNRAIDYFSRALAALKKAYKKDHSTWATCLNNLGMAYCDQGNYPLAIDYFSQALAAFQVVYGDDHLLVVRCRNNLAVARSRASSCCVIL